MTVRVTHVKMGARALTASTPTSAFVVMAGRAPSVKQVSRFFFSSRWEDGRGGERGKYPENTMGLIY